MNSHHDYVFYKKVDFFINLITEYFTATSSGSGTLAFMNAGSETTGNWYIDDVTLQKFSLEDDNITTGNDFFTAYKYTLGYLPFIFQPDSNNSQPDGFAIAKFIPDSIRIRRKSLNAYNFSVKIQEVW